MGNIRHELAEVTTRNHQRPLFSQSCAILKSAYCIDGECWYLFAPRVSDMIEILKPAIRKCVFSWLNATPF